MMYDVAIVGAGPAGGWAARSLARLGARVLLVDPSHPREKPCGGGVTGRALQVVSDALGERPPARVAVRSARFTASSTRQAVDVRLHDDALWVMSRREFDGRLVDAARHEG